MRHKPLRPSALKAVGHASGLATICKSVDTMLFLSTVQAGLGSLTWHICHYSTGIQFSIEPAVTQSGKATSKHLQSRTTFARFSVAGPVLVVRASTVIFPSADVDWDFWCKALSLVWSATRGIFSEQ